MPAPTPIKRVGTNHSAPVSQSTIAKSKVKMLFCSHRIGGLWRNADSHNDDYYHEHIDTSDLTHEECFNKLIEIGFEYALGECMKDPYLKHSGAINEEQTKWFRAFGNRHDGMLGINPIDQPMHYEKYFGSKIAIERIAYSTLIPSGNVLCFSWLRDNYMHLELMPDASIDVWMKYNTQVVNPAQYVTDLEDIITDESDIIDSMLVNILELSGPSLMDELLNGLI